MAAVKKVNSFLSTESENYEGSMGNKSFSDTSTKNILMIIQSFIQSLNEDLDLQDKSPYFQLPGIQSTAFPHILVNYDRATRHKPLSASRKDVQYI